VRGQARQQLGRLCGRGVHARKGALHLHGEMQDPELLLSADRDLQPPEAEREGSLRRRRGQQLQREGGRGLPASRTEVLRVQGRYGPDPPRQPKRRHQPVHGLHGDRSIDTGSQPHVEQPRHLLLRRSNGNLRARLAPLVGGLAHLLGRHLHRRARRGGGLEVRARGDGPLARRHGDLAALPAARGRHRCRQAAASRAAPRGGVDPLPAGRRDAPLRDRLRCVRRARLLLRSTGIRRPRAARGGGRRPRQRGPSRLRPGDGAPAGPDGRPRPFVGTAVRHCVRGRPTISRGSLRSSG
jgi:hypothetical protein